MIWFSSLPKTTRTNEISKSGKKIKMFLESLFFIFCGCDDNNDNNVDDDDDNDDVDNNDDDRLLHILVEKIVIFTTIIFLTWEMIYFRINAYLEIHFVLFSL